MLERFSSLNGYGREELEKLEDSKVGVIGLGATGSVIAEHLARHKIDLVLFDRDYLEEKDLYTSFYRKDQVEKSLPKAAAAEEILSEFTQVEAMIESVGSDNIEKLEDLDLIVDGTDNMETRFLINEFSKRENIPWIYTAAIGEKGYSMLFIEKCFNCVFEQVTPGTLDTCETAGVMREVSALAASRSSYKAIRFLAGKDVSEKLDTVSGDRFEVESKGCKVCKENCFTELNSTNNSGSVCGENKYQIEKDIGESAFERLKENSDVLSQNKYLIRAEKEGRKIVLFRSGRAIIEAKNRHHAESVFSEIIGV